MCTRNGAAKKPIAKIIKNSEYSFNGGNSSADKSAMSADCQHILNFTYLCIDLTSALDQFYELESLS